MRFKYIVAALLICGPVAAQTATLDALYAELLRADDAGTLRIEQQITAQWQNSGSAAMDLLFRRGNDALKDGNFDAAVDHFSALVDHAPQFTEGYFARASAYYLTEQFGPAMADLGRVLHDNPRHFPALRALAVLLEQTGRPAEALALHIMVLDMMPQSAQSRGEVDRLQLQFEGKAI